ncbi:cache domain-containing protein [Polymorphum gilvum]|uniref:Conserved hypothetical exported protein n=1 Tax=Polymorphum gilvum (strain LMG 25793 / CGMCC 1.9160 / SL003B-26A1) TaxID=991905 RepID=F2J0F1_POLGS|nr:cache domain-containing protein [Polymorphum gilvum]ADZ69619.1 Conserved hypothetical exported protein [Polymorphum gilvum SL003B-26A1]
MWKSMVIAAFSLALSGGGGGANEFRVELTELAKGRIARIAADPALVEAIRVQNALTADYDQSRIDALDEAWRAQARAASRPMIDEVLQNPLSRFLAQVQVESDGLFTEIFAMDAKGLNVGQSLITTDYWQGDEAKWQETFGADAGAVHIGELEFDESTQTLQSQVSVPVLDPDDGQPIGAITFGVDVEKL